MKASQLMQLNEHEAHPVGSLFDRRRLKNQKTSTPSSEQNDVFEEAITNGLVHQSSDDPPDFERFFEQQALIAQCSDPATPLNSQQSQRRRSSIVKEAAPTSRRSSGASPSVKVPPTREEQRNSLQPKESYHSSKFPHSCPVTPARRSSLAAPTAYYSPSTNVSNNNNNSNGQQSLSRHSSVRPTLSDISQHKAELRAASALLRTANIEKEFNELSLPDRVEFARLLFRSCNSKRQNTINDFIDQSGLNHKMGNDRKHALPNLNLHGGSNKDQIDDIQRSPRRNGEYINGDVGGKKYKTYNAKRCSLQTPGSAYNSAKLSPGPRSPKRSQSARCKNGHRPVGYTLSGNSPAMDFPVEFRDRTNSTPGDSILDEWPSAQQRRILLNRFLQLPESEDFERQRNFAIDPKGGIINRGDSFRRRCHTGQSSLGTATSTEPSDSPQTNSIVSSRAHSPNNATGLTPPVSPAVPRKLTVLVTGMDGTGKTSLVNQFLSSEASTHPFCSVEDDPTEKKILVSLEGSEYEMTFIESDYSQENSWQTAVCDGYIIVYAADSEASYHDAADILRFLKEQPDTCQKPAILVANKVDLARKRAVETEDGRALAKRYEACKFVEVSAALSHNTDKLLVGILAQIRNFYNKTAETCASPTLRQHHHNRKLSLKALAVPEKREKTTSCSNISAVGRSIVQKILKRSSSRSCDNLLS